VAFENVPSFADAVSVDTPFGAFDVPVVLGGAFSSML